MAAAPWQGPPVAEKPPLVLAALGPRMLELAAERSAGALLYNATPEATATARSVLGSGPLLAAEQPVLLEVDKSVHVNSTVGQGRVYSGPPAMRWTAWSIPWPLRTSSR